MARELNSTPVIAAIVPVAILAFTVAILARAASNGAQETEEQREAVYARDGESAEDANARLEECVSSDFGLCPPYSR